MGGSDGQKVYPVNNASIVLAGYICDVACVYCGEDEKKIKNNNKRKQMDDRDGGRLIDPSKVHNVIH